MRFNRSVLTAVTLILLVLTLGGCQPSQPRPRPASEDLGVKGNSVPTGVVQPGPTDTPVPTRWQVTEVSPTHSSDVEPARTSAPSAPTVTPSSAPTAANLLGHEVKGNKLTFVFDEGVYGLQGEVASVAVAGKFQRMEQPCPRVAVARR